MKLNVCLCTLLLAASASAGAADGKAIYEKTCAACHATGVAQAPKFGDKAAWAPRIEQGDATLLASVTKGKGAMPPKGGVSALTEAELSAAVAYMVNAAK